MKAPTKGDDSLNIHNSLTPKHENHKVLGEENSSEVNSLQNNMMWKQNKNKTTPATWQHDTENDKGAPATGAPPKPLPAVRPPARPPAAECA